MSTILRYLEFLSLGTWVGSILFLRFVVARGAFALFSGDQAGRRVSLLPVLSSWNGTAPYLGVYFRS